MERRNGLRLSAVRRKLKNEIGTLAALAGVIVCAAIGAESSYDGAGAAVLLVAVVVFLGRMHDVAAVNLREKIVGVTEVAAREDSPVFWDAAAEASAAAGLPLPRLFILWPFAPSACSWGLGPRRSVGVRGSVLDELPAPFVRPLVAHEIAHLKLRDGLFWHLVAAAFDAAKASVVVLGIAGFVAVFDADSNVRVVLGLAVMLAAAFAIMAIAEFSRYWLTRLSVIQELAADAFGAWLVGAPATMAAMLMWFGIDDGRDDESGMRTHPPTSERIAALTGISLKKR